MARGYEEKLEIQRRLAAAKNPLQVKAARSMVVGTVHLQGTNVDAIVNKYVDEKGRYIVRLPPADDLLDWSPGSDNRTFKEKKSLCKVTSLVLSLGSSVIVKCSER